MYPPCGAPGCQEDALWHGPPVFNTAVTSNEADGDGRVYRCHQHRNDLIQRLREEVT